jgi:hypothetical protein
MRGPRAQLCAVCWPLRVRLGAPCCDSWAAIARVEQVTWTSVTWTSTSLAATVVRRGRRRGFRVVYACGAVFGVAGLVIAMAMLAANLGSNVMHIARTLGPGLGAGTAMRQGEDSLTLARSEGRPDAGTVLQTEAHTDGDTVWAVKALIPGVNLPLLHFSYVFLAGRSRL